MIIHDDTHERSDCQICIPCVPGIVCDSVCSSATDWNGAFVGCSFVLNAAFTVSPAVRFGTCLCVTGAVK